MAFAGLDPLWAAAGLNVPVIDDLRHLGAVAKHESPGQTVDDHIAV